MRANSHGQHSKNIHKKPTDGKKPRTWGTPDNRRPRFGYGLLKKGQNRPSWASVSTCRRMVGIRKKRKACTRRCTVDLNDLFKKMVDETTDRRERSSRRRSNFNSAINAGYGRKMYQKCSRRTQWVKNVSKTRPIKDKAIYYLTV